MLDTSRKEPSYTRRCADDIGSATFGGDIFLNSISSHLIVLAPDPADLPVMDAGKIDATSTTSRQIQFGLKTIR